MPSEPDPVELQGRLRMRTAELSAAHKRIEEIQEKLTGAKETSSKLKAVRQERDGLRGSAEYWVGRKLIRPFRKLFGNKDATGKPAAPSGSAQRPRASYHQWRLTQIPSEARLLEMAGECRRFPSFPLISIVMPAYNTPPGMIEDAIGSVRAQVYENWELIAVDDASAEPHVYPVLKSLSEKDSRIVVGSTGKNAGIAMASNAALAMAKGEFVAFLDHDDWIEPDALFEVARRIIEEPDADFIYSDEDKVDEAGYFQKPFFKPDWSPDAFLSTNYCCHLTAIRRALVEEIGGFRAGFDGAQDYDLFLRATERARRITHIPRVLYHWRISAHSTARDPGTKPAAFENGRRALEEAIRRRGLDATAESLPAHGSYRVKYRIKTARKISILIPARDHADALTRCVESLERNTGWPAYDAIIVDNESSDPSMLRFLRETKHRALKCKGPFNFGAVCNLGARESDGEWLLFLDHHAEFTEPDWLSAMAEHAQRPEVGAVGAQMLSPTGAIQPGGVVLTDSDEALAACFNFPQELLKDGCLRQMIRNYSAVTGACVLVRRAVFDEVGGFDEQYTSASYSHVDLCLRIRARSYSIVYTPYARLKYHPAVPMGNGQNNSKDARILREKWASALAHDPFNNPNIVERMGSMGGMRGMAPNLRENVRFSGIAEREELRIDRSAD